MKKIAIVFLSLFIIVGCSYNGVERDDDVLPVEENKVSLESSCAKSGGTWLEEFQECEYTSKQWCDQNAGSFNECSSACRNNPEAEMCTMQCVPVCQFNVMPKMHESWDQDGDGLNDCEKEGICDHTVDYTKPRNK